MVEFVIEDDLEAVPVIGALYECPYATCALSHLAEIVGISEDRRAKVVFTDRAFIEVIEFDRLVRHV